MCYDIDKDITRAYTLPTEYYREKKWWTWSKDHLFAKSWQWIGTKHKYSSEANVYPGKLLPDYLDQPFMITRGTPSQWSARSNVCTHRGALLVTEPMSHPLIRCPYHGRCFGLDGRFRSMPGFEGVQNFPSDADHLAVYHLHDWQSLLFLKTKGDDDFNSIFKPIVDLMAFYPLIKLKPWRSSTYQLNAHWALYVDNYLEGFHVPYVHPGLMAKLDLNRYETQLFAGCSMQIGVAKPDEPHLNIPPDHPLAGQAIYALYWWLFPNLMLNFYPWGLSLNLVVPITRHRTRIEFHYYLLEGADEQWLEDTGIHQTELEDEAIVELVHQGLQSGVYHRGRFSPLHEKGVHHFHRMISETMKANPC